MNARRLPIAFALAMLLHGCDRPVCKVEPNALVRSHAKREPAKPVATLLVWKVGIDRPEPEAAQHLMAEFVSADGTHLCLAFDEKGVWFVDENCEHDVDPSEFLVLISGMRHQLIDTPR